MSRPSSAPPASPNPAPGAPSRAGAAVLSGALLVVALVLLLLVRAWAPPAPPPAHLTSSTSAAPSASEAPPDEDRTPEIHGHVLDADGNAVDGATVRLVSARPPYTVYAEIQSARGGAFSFARVGPWRLRVVADHGADGIVTSAVLAVAERNTIEITLVLSAAGAVHGTVVDAKDHPVSGAVLSVEGVPWIIAPATSDDAGAFRLTVVPDEATSIVAVARGYRTARASLGPHDDLHERVVRVVLTAAESVHGEVRDAEGNPAHARIVACADQPSEARAASGDDGSFELPPSAIGCEVVAENAEYAPSDPVAVVEGQRLLLRLKPGGSIDGVVVDDHGVGVPSYSLGIESFSPARGRGFDRVGPRNIEDGRGAFRWDRLAPGTYVLTAAPAGKAPSRSDPIDVRGGAVARARIVVSQGGILTGYVYDEAHAPLGGVELRFDQVSSAVASKASARSDDRGMYRLEGAPDGPSTLLVRKDGYRTKLVSGVRVGSGATLRLDVTLAGRDGGAGLELGGIGATLNQSGTEFSLGDVYEGDPAARAGLRKGDRVLRIDAEPTDGMSMADVLQRLRGEPGTTVGVSIVRPETGETVQLTIVRARIVR